MGLLHALGRLWPGSSEKDRRRDRDRLDARASNAIRPLAIDLHTDGAGEDVAPIDRELASRLGPTGTIEVLDPGSIAPDKGASVVRPESGAGPVLAALLAPPGTVRGRAKSKQQILDELRGNYEEVIRVVRKVDSTLDQQHRRGERMLEIAEHTVHGRLPELREETRKVADAIDRMATGLGRSHDRLEQGVMDQIAAIERVESLLGQLVEHDRALGDSLIEFRRTAAGMAVATERLGSTLAGIQERASRRDEQMATILQRSQSTLVTVLVLSLVSVAAAITMVVLSLV